MKLRVFTKVLGVVAGVALIQVPQTAQACAMCMGAPDSNTGQALNGAIFLMLGFLALVMSGIGAVIYSLVRRSRAQIQSLNPDVSHPVS